MEDKYKSCVKCSLQMKVIDTHEECYSQASFYPKPFCAGGRQKNVTKQSELASDTKHSKVKIEH